MLKIIKYYIPDKYDIKYLKKMNNNNEEMEFDDIYLLDYQNFAIVNVSDGSIIKSDDTTHINVENFLNGLKAGLNINNVEYEITGEVITEKEWEGIEKEYNEINIKDTKHIATCKYKYCNHHHELNENYKIVNFGDGDFVANKEAIPILKALNEIGLKTRSHHIDKEEHAWVCILLDGVELEIRDVYEKDATRTKYNGKEELLIQWKK
jgi:uncharacterized membrane-anchored protein